MDGGQHGDQKTESRKEDGQGVKRGAKKSSGRNKKKRRETIVMRKGCRWNIWGLEFMREGIGFGGRGQRGRRERED